MASPQFQKKKPPKKKNHISPEGREKLSRLAKERVEKGVMGGAKFGKKGGRPRKPRASQEVAEEARKAAQDLVQVFKDGIDPEKPMGTRLKAAELWLGIEEKEAKLQLAEEKQDEQLDRDEIIKRLAQGLLSGAVGAAMRQEAVRVPNEAEADEDIVDAEVVNHDGDSPAQLEAA